MKANFLLKKGHECCSFDDNFLQNTYKKKRQPASCSIKTDRSILKMPKKLAQSNSNVATNRYADKGAIKIFG